MTRASIIAAALCIGASTAEADDFIFASSFEVLICNGAGCSYCSPVDPTPLCGSDSHCSPQADSTSVCSYPAGTGMTGALCSALADCAGPYACIDTGAATQTCRHWCQVGLSGSCSGGQTCVALSPPQFTGTTQWGVCL